VLPAVTQPCVTRLCVCHGEPMYWNRDTRKKADGYWRCRVVRKAHDARYTTSEKGLARHRTYNASDRGSVRSRLYEIGRARTGITY